MDAAGPSDEHLTFLEANEIEQEIEEDASDIEDEDLPASELSDDYDEYDEMPDWQEEPIEWHGKTPARNVFKSKAGLTNYSRNITSPIEAFNLFMTEEIVQLILTHTNARMIQENLLPTDTTELAAFFGVLYSMGVMRQTNVSLRTLWSTSKNKHGHIEEFAAVMSRNRFIEIYRKIRFDDIETREERRRGNKFALLEEVTEKLRTACIKAYSVDEDVTVDEGMTPFRGRCPFKIYMPKKPARYGIKTWFLTDSFTRYVKNFVVYTGKQSDG